MKHPIFLLFVLMMLGAAMAAPAAASADSSQKAPPETFTSPIRGQCQDDLRKDHLWRAQLEEELRSKVHQAVVMAYAALWIIVVLFVMFMWIRQGDLKKQIARLEQDIAAAEADGEKAT